jgi:hypothetical protein
MDEPKLVRINGCEFQVQGLLWLNVPEQDNGHGVQEFSRTQDVVKPAMGVTAEQNELGFHGGDLHLNERIF